jgi:hypothetical protein
MRPIDRMKKMQKTRKSVTRGWKNEAPHGKERTAMSKKCGKKCFLGPKMSFPICTKKTCRVNPRGVHSAYTRARQWKHTRVAAKAKALLRKMNTRKHK